MRYQKFFLLVISILTVISLFAGEKTNFSGQWVFNEGKSVLDENGAAFLPARMGITQADNDLTIQKTFQSEFADNFTAEEKMTLDGKECKSEFMNSPRIFTALWTEKGDTLKIESKITFNNEGETSEMFSKEAWTLAEDGKLLSIRHFSSSAWGERKITIVYNKEEAPKEQAPTEEKK